MCKSSKILVVFISLWPKVDLHCLAKGHMLHIQVWSKVLAQRAESMYLSLVTGMWPYLKCQSLIESTLEHVSVALSSCICWLDCIIKVAFIESCFLVEWKSPFANSPRFHGLLIEGPWKKHPEELNITEQLRSLTSLGTKIRL